MGGTSRGLDITSSPGSRCRRGQATHTRRSALLSRSQPPHGACTPGIQPGRWGDPDAWAPGRTSTSPGPTWPTVRPRSVPTWTSLSPGLRIELTTKSSRRRHPRRPRHPSPPATCCPPTRTGLTQGTRHPGADSFASATVTTQLGTGPAPEFSYPDKRPGPATTRRPGQPRQGGTLRLRPLRPTGSKSVGMAQETPGRSGDPTCQRHLPGQTLHSCSTTAGRGLGGAFQVSSRKVREARAPPLFPHPLTNVTQLTQTAPPFIPPRAIHQQ